MNTRFLRFLVSGGTAAAVEYVAFLGLYWALHPKGLLISQSLSFLAGLAISFLLNRNWVFKSSGNSHAQFAKYLLLAYVNLIIGNLAIATLAGHLGMAIVAAKLVVMALIAAWNYLLLSMLIFVEKK